jgi:U4/U6.U5 tri-snRNP component SNU23
MQPPKPTEKPPHLQKNPASNNPKKVPPPEKRRLLQPVGRDFNPDSVLGQTIVITA